MKIPIAQSSQKYLWVAASYFVMLAGIAAYASVAFHELYEVATNDALNQTYHGYLKYSSLTLSLVLGIGSGLFGVWRKSWWQGIAALAAGVIVTLSAFSLLPWEFFEHDKYAAPAAWVFTAGVPALLAWGITSLFGAIYFRHRIANATT